MRSFAFVLAALTIGACGGSAFTTASSDAGGGSGADASGGDAAQGAGDGGGQNGDGSSAGDGGGGTGDGASTEAGAACPDVSGTYMIGGVQGGGCGDLNDNAKQCIRMNAQISACGIAFVSPTPNGSTGAINGFTQIQTDGSFSNANLREGTVSRSGCTGTWVAGTSTMTVDCGGNSTTQSCVVVLTRTGPPSCN